MRISRHHRRDQRITGLLCRSTCEVTLTDDSSHSTPVFCPSFRIKQAYQVSWWPQCVHPLRYCRRVGPKERAWMCAVLPSETDWAWVYEMHGRPRW